MKANELIRAVNEEVARKWQNSDISAMAQVSLERIAGHFEKCQFCFEEFDRLGYPQETIQEFARDFIEIRGDKIIDWICTKE